MKKFNSWNKIKKNIEKSEKLVFIKEGQIWWNHLGCNIGHEQDGKGMFFERPVLIIKKFNERIFLGIPLTTKNKNNKFYYPFLDSKGVLRSAIISQIRLLDVSRLSEKEGFISKNDFKEIKKAIKKMF